jgi:hypothetical protein
MSGDEYLVKLAVRGEGTPAETGDASFEAFGTYWDRTLLNEYPILTDWLGGRARS